MHNRALPIAVLTGCAWFSTAAAPGALSAERPASVLEAVKALDKPFTYTETKIPLGELVQKVAADTGVTLTAAREVADEPVAVVVEAMPARELLEQFADLLDYRWSRRGKGEAVRYEIWQDLASKEREAALREARLRAAEKRLQDQVRRSAELAALSQDQVEAMLAAEEQRGIELMKLPVEQRQQRLLSPEGQERTRRHIAAQSLRTPIVRALARLLGRLSPQQWAALRSEQILTFSTDPHSGELALPPEIGAAFRAASPTLFRPGTIFALSDPAEDEQRSRREQAIQQQWAAAAGHRVTVRLDARRFPTSGLLSLRADAAPLGDASSPRSALLAEGARLTMSSGPLDVFESESERGPERRAELEKDPVLSARKRFKPEAKPDRLRLLSDRAPSWRLRDLLPDLARIFEVQFISDAYSATAPETIDGGSSAPEPTALFRLLDAMAGGSYRWDRQGRLIRLRSRTWFLDRQREVPLRLIRRWEATYRQYGALPLEDTVRAATLLNDGQLETLADPRQLETGSLPVRDTCDIYRARHALRLYASLSSTQRQALWQGATLPAAQMTPTQRRLFVAAREEGSPDGPPLPDLAQGVSGFSLTAAGTSRVVGMPGDEAGVRTAAGSPDETAHHNSSPGGKDLLGRRLPVTQISFELQYDSETLEQFIIVASPF